MQIHTSGIEPMLIKEIRNKYLPGRIPLFTIVVTGLIVLSFAGISCGNVQNESANNTTNSPDTEKENQGITLGGIVKSNGNQSVTPKKC